MNHTLVLGEKDYSISEDEIRSLARRSLLVIRPQRIVTDYALGWNSIMVEEARKVGVPYVGVLPYPSDNQDYRKLSKSTTNTILYSSKEEFLTSPFLYLSWLNQHVSEVIAFIDPEKVNFNKTILKSLKEKTIRNIFPKK